MPEIDLKPDDYTVTDERGRTFRRDEPIYWVIGLVVCVAALVGIFLARDQFTTGTLFGVTLVFAASSGGLVALLTKDIR